MSEHGGEVLQLTMNFRTLDTVTTQLNDVFVKELPESETKYQAAYRPLNSYHEDLDARITGIKKLVVPEEFSTKQEVILQKDAENISLYLQKLLQEGHKPKEFMIITRYNDGIDVYARTLEAAGIPISVSGEMMIGATQEFNELLLLLNVFVDTTDRIPTVAALRSVWFGISDEELFQWKTAGGSFSIFAQTPESLKEASTHPVEKALSKLRMYAKWVSANSPVVAIEKILENIGFYPLMLARGYGKREHTQFLQLIEALRKEEDAGNTLYYSAVHFLTKAIESKTKVVNLDEDANAVRILNVHKAKGLEAPIVFLAHPGKKTDISVFISSHIKREEQGSKGYFRFTKKFGNPPKSIAQPKNWEEHKAEEETYLLQEEIRILYVAATRAEKAIIISACEKKNTKNPWNMLLNGLTDIEEVSIDLDEALEKETNIETITQQTYQQETEHLSDWIEESAAPSFTKFSPTDDKEEIYTLGIEREEGG
jgi:ATP-dependent helicase/nuclease subunit A